MEGRKVPPARTCVYCAAKNGRGRLCTMCAALQCRPRQQIIERSRESAAQTSVQYTHTLALGRDILTKMQSAK